MADIGKMLRKIWFNSIIRSKFRSDVLKENYCLIKVYFVSDQFNVNSFFLFCLFAVVVFLILVYLFPGEARGIDLKIFPRGCRSRCDLISRAFFNSPYLSRVWGWRGGVVGVSIDQCLVETY